MYYKHILMDKLLDYQKYHVSSMIESLLLYERALDASDTGTGKTYTAVALCKIMELKPFVICPKSVKSSWSEVLDFFECEYIGITTYESLQNCSYSNCKNEKQDVKFLKKITKQTPEGVVEIDYVIDKNHIPANTIVIYDEAHKCKNPRTINGKILCKLACVWDLKMILLSATVVDKPNFFLPIGLALGIYKSINEGIRWMKRINKNNNNIMKSIHSAVFPNRASRMTITMCKEYFPDCNIVAESYVMGNEELIQDAWNEIRVAIDEIKRNDKSNNPLVRILRARQKIEMLKLPEIVAFAEEELRNGKSVVIFVNFKETMKALGKKLGTPCLIHGTQKEEERAQYIRDFQNNANRVCICGIKAGGCGISLHDVHGGCPRISLISPTWSAQDLIQVLGRIHRANGKSIVKQKILFCKNTIEDSICKIIKNKILNISNLNDGHANSYKIEGMEQDVPDPDPNAVIEI